MRTRHLVAAFTAVVLLPASSALLTSSQAAAEPTPEEVEADIQERNTELEKVIEDFNAANEELEDAEELIADIEAELPELEAEVAESTDRIADIVGTAYIGGDLEMLNSVLSGDPGDFADRMTYLQTLSEAETAEIEGHIERAQELQARKEELESLREDADDILADLEEQQEEIEAEIDELEVLLDEVTPDPPPADTPNYSGGSEVVQFVYDQLGDPYEYGSEGPDSWDCSGLVQGAWRQVGASLSHNVAMQWNETARISRDELQPGDIVFYDGLGHNGIYIGGGEIIHAPHTGDVVRIADMDIMAIQGYGRP